MIVTGLFHKTIDVDPSSGIKKLTALGNVFDLKPPLAPMLFALPEGWLRSRELSGESARIIREAELSVSGG